MHLRFLAARLFMNSRNLAQTGSSHVARKCLLLLCDLCLHLVVSTAKLCNSGFGLELCLISQRVGPGLLQLNIGIALARGRRTQLLLLCSLLSSSSLGIHHSGNCCCCICPRSCCRSRCRLHFDQAERGLLKLVSASGGFFIQVGRALLF